MKVSPNTFKSIKECLFGLQKQANVINDGVITIIASELARLGYPEFNDSEEVKDAINELLTKLLQGTDTFSDEALLLIVGPQGWANLDAVGPKYVYVDKPSTESPKWIFRINMLGEDAEVETEVDPGEKLAENISKPAVSPDEVYSPSDDFYTRARKIKDAILPMVPAAVKTEIADNEFAQALCCAEYFYGYGK